MEEGQVSGYPTRSSAIYESMVCAIIHTDKEWLNTNIGLSAKSHQEIEEMRESEHGCSGVIVKHKSQSGKR